MRHPLLTVSAFLIPLFFISSTKLQNTQSNDCPATGKTKKHLDPKPNMQALNIKKNRKINPKNSDFDPTVSLQSFMTSGDDSTKFDQNKAVTIEGYILRAKDEEGESCNCYSGNAQDHDIHVYIAPTNPTKIGQCAVVELTPWTKKLHPEWTKDYINANLAHHKVRVTGWLMFDFEHMPVSYLSRPELTTDKAQRYTVWEVHPITNLSLEE